MTNFENILRSTTREHVADALSACFEGQCDQCPALELCNQMGDQEEVGCADVMTLWLNLEAEPTTREKAGELFGRIGSCKKCPAIEECRAHIDTDCIDILTAYVERLDDESS